MDACSADPHCRAGSPSRSQPSCLAGRYFFSDKFGAELGYGLGIYAVRLDREGSNEEGFAGIDVTGKIRYNVNGLRIGGVYAF